MENVWIKVLNQSISVSIVILAVLLVRGIVMSKVPKKYVFLLWVVVGLRLLIPVGVTTSIHCFQTVPDKVEQSTEKSIEKESLAQKEVKVESPGITEGKTTNAETQNSQSVSTNSSQTMKSEETEKQSVEKVLSQMKQRIASQKVIQVTAYLWIGGMVLFGVWNLLMYVQMKKRLGQAVLYKDNIYECDKIGSPFVMGLMRPRIYIPFRLREEELSYILKHEQYHIKRKDYLTKLVACILLGIYWFHPLVWMAYFFMVRDMEMSCDEYVVQTMGDEIKKEYSTSLLAFATNTRRMSMGMLAFGESGTRKRVKHILKSKKTAKWVGVIGVILVLATGIFGFATSNIGEPIKNVEKGAELKVEEEENAAKQASLSFQKSEKRIDGFYCGRFTMPLQPVANEEFTGQVTEVYEKIQLFAEEYKDPKWSTIPEAEYDYTFPTVAKANEFLGFHKILHPLEKEEQVHMEIFGGDSGFIHAAYIDTDYTVDGKKVKISNIIATEYLQRPTGKIFSCGHTEMFSHIVSLYAGMNGYTIKIMSEKDFSYNQSFYSLGDLDVTVLETKQDDLVTVEAYFVIDGILYVAGMEVPQEEVANANSTLEGIVERYAEQSTVETAAAPLAQGYQIEVPDSWKKKEDTDIPLTKFL